MYIDASSGRLNDSEKTSFVSFIGKRLKKIAFYSLSIKSLWP